MYSWFKCVKSSLTRRANKQPVRFFKYSERSVQSERKRKPKHAKKSISQLNESVRVFELKYYSFSKRLLQLRHDVADAIRYFVFTTSINAYARLGTSVCYPQPIFFFFCFYHRRLCRLL